MSALCQKRTSTTLYKVEKPPPGGLSEMRVGLIRPQRQNCPFASSATQADPMRRGRREQLIRHRGALKLPGGSRHGFDVDLLHLFYNTWQKPVLAHVPCAGRGDPRAEFCSRNQTRPCELTRGVL